VSTASEVLRRLGVLALVLVVMAQPMAAPALAASSSSSASLDPGDDDDDGFAGDECGRSFSTLFADVLTGNFDESQDCEARELAQGISDNQTLVENFNSGLALEDLRKAGITPILNHLNHSKTYARTIAKTTAVQAFNNNTSRSETKELVNESIEDYYVTFQMNLESTHATNVKQLYYASMAEDNSTLEQGSIAVDDPTDYQDNNFIADQVESQWTRDSPWEAIKLMNKTVSFVDGKSRNITVLEMDGFNGIYAYLEPTDQLTGLDADGNSWNKFYGIYVADPQEEDYLKQDISNSWNYDQFNSDNSAELYDQARYHHAWVQVNQTAEDVKTNAALYVDALFDTYEPPIDVEKVLDPLTLSSQWNTKYNSTGYHGWPAAELGLTGLEGNISNSFQISYTPAANHTPTQNFSLNTSEPPEYVFTVGDSENLSGSLMTDWAPSSTDGKFVAGETYNTSNADADVIFVQQVNENRSRIVNLDGEFTILEMTNVKEGTQINETTLSKQNQQTWNESRTIKEYRQLSQYRENVTDINEVGGGGTGSGGFDFGDLGLPALAIGGLVGLLLLAGGGSGFLGSKAS
jgi:hypothetical protein